MSNFGIKKIFKKCNVTRKLTLFAFYSHKTVLK